MFVVTQYPRGSEWRRWELHIHSPGTLKNDQFAGSTIDEKWERYYSDIKTYIGDGSVTEKSIAVIALTDYLSVDNYFKIKSYDNLPDSVKLIIPNVELRVAPISGETPINIHCLFCPTIDQQLTSRFFGKLKFSFGSSTYSATNSELIRLGRDYSNNQDMDELQARKIGVRQYVIPWNVIQDIFNDDPGLREKTLIIVSNKSTDGASGLIKHSDYFIEGESQLGATRQAIYQLADAIFSSNENDIRYFTGNGADCADEVRRKCGNLMPCFHGCDAHENSKIFKPDKDRFCWIKSDPTFEGLKQVINEPQDRVFIGRIPDVITRVNQNKTKYISQLFIDTYNGREDTGNIWFRSNRILLNNELVAIIGNKGSGKSAIADIIGLCADAEHSDDFLFLSTDKFKKKGYAERFYANLQFVSGTKLEDRPLSYDIEATELPKVQYLPQQYFEKICNEIVKIEYFRKEIEKVVFQYIPEDKRLKKNTFSELINFRKDNIDREIVTLKNKLDKINEIIITLEDKKNPEYKKSLESKRAAKEEELCVHLAQKPREKINPVSIDDAKSQREVLEPWESKLQECNEQVASIQSEITSCAIEIEELKQFKRDIENKVKEAEQFIEQKRSFLDKYSIDILKVYSIKYDISPIDAAINLKESESFQRKESLGESDLPDNPVFDELKLRAKVIFCNEEIEKIKKTLSQAEQEYQHYLEDLKKWEQKKAEIEGTKETTDTLEFFKDQIAYIENELEQVLLDKRNERLSISKSIYTKKEEIKVFYDEIKAEIDAILLYDLKDCQGSNLTIDSSFSLDSDFIESVMFYINKSKAGSFRGYDEGKKLFQEKIISSLNTNSYETIEILLNNTIDYLENDRRDLDKTKHKPTFIGDQITKRIDFYRFLFSLDYIEPHYELRQNGKSLEKLSPGEKGALLLVFYLLLDRSPNPLIIDQPEDNLDNNSVYKILVPFIQKAKKQRQIIMVTHNPNLAVAADAEQIIRVSIDKEKGNIFSFISGSIENPAINKEIVDVLEGTMPAFKIRKNKYYNKY